MIFRYYSSKATLFCGILWSSFFVVIKSDDSQNDISECELERLLNPILIPPDDNSIQAQALRQRLADILRQSLGSREIDSTLDDKRSVSSLARWNAFPATKRNVQALARAGLLTNQREQSSEDEGDDASSKRNVYYENEQQEQQQQQQQQQQEQAEAEEEEARREESKRGIQSLARNGELPSSTKHQIEELLEELYEKRNIGSLARDFNFPNYGKRFIGSLARSGDLGSRYIAGNNKRNIASIVRNGRGTATDYGDYKRSLASLARNGERIGKRNVAALLRQDNYLNRRNERQRSETGPEKKGDMNFESKRNIASIKAGGFKSKFKRSIPFIDEQQYNARNKRQADYYDDINDEYLQPVYQNNYNYDELVNELNDAYPKAEKRFLGSVARTGWPTSLVKYHNSDKRHIGSLARLGWLPSLRSIRRFNRSGRSSTDADVDVCRSTSSNGKNENDSYSKSSSEDKRVLLIPAVGKVRLRRFPMAPRMNY